VAAEIGKGNAKGAAAGALAAELAGVILGDNIIKPEEWQKKSEQQAQMARVLGAAAGAVFTGKSDGAYSGATGGENAFRYNYLSHKQQELMEKDLAAAKSPLDKAVVLANWGITSHTQDGAFAAGVVSGIPVEISDTVDGLVAVASNPREAADALIALIKNDERFSIIGESVKQEYLGRIETFKTKYEHAGVDGAFGAGLEFGKLTMAGLGLFAGAAGAGKLGVKITTNSIKALEKTTVKDLTALGLTREQQTIIRNAEGISTAKAHQATAPRDLNEQVLWNLVKQNPEKGIGLDLNKDPKFSTDAGFKKMQVVHTLPDGNNIVIHYQYNKYTGKAYDMKFDSPKRNDLQPGPSIKGDKNL
ncbi:filamentous hemagglutinin, partial [Serratia marcescens]